MKKALWISIICVLGASYNFAQNPDPLLDSIVEYAYLSHFDSIAINKQLYAYDNAGNQTSMALYYWDGVDEKWAGGSSDKYIREGKFERSYDSSGNENLITSYIWDHYNNRWELYKKEEKSYDFEGISLSIGYIYDDSLAWVNEYKLEYSYDTAGTQTSESYYRWYSDELDWTPESKTVFGYDISGNKTSKTNFGWNLSKNDWVPSVMETYYHGGPDDTDWVPEWKIERDYNKSGNRMIEAKIWWDPFQSKWFSLRKNYYYYSSSANGLVIYTQEEITSFPNPTTGLINITGLSQPAEVKIYSIQGQLLKSKHGVENTVDISDLPGGVYILKIFSGEPILQRTIIKRDM